MGEFTEASNIFEALQRSPAVVEAFKRLGLKCAGCIAAEKETLHEAALYHEKDLRSILAELNRIKLPPP